MVTPEQIRCKAVNLYRPFLIAWLTDDDTFFPYVIRANKSRDKEDVVAAKKAFIKLREGSKQNLGYGYTVETADANYRDIGRNPRVKQIRFETQEDFLRLLRKQREFAGFAKAVKAMRSAFPELESWVRVPNVRRFIKLAPHIEGLLHVLEYFKTNPRPNLFVRELPLSVDTKFIQRHRAVLREWLDLILPLSPELVGEKHFERRYGLRYAEPHFYVRVLDPEIKRELGMPFEEFSLPLSNLASLHIERASVFIVENKISLLTLPPMPRTIALGGMGKGITLLGYVPWLAKTPINYWGDLDVEGFEILSSLRTLFPHARSVFMDLESVVRWYDRDVSGKGSQKEIPYHLTDSEKAAFLRCRDENLRIEQEPLPHFITRAAVIYDP